MSTSDAQPEIDPLTGYPPVTDSSPAEGAHTEGVSPDAGEAAPSQPQETRHEPPPDSPRFNEVYRKWKETERELEAYRQRDLEQTYAPDPTPPAEPQATGEDEWSEFRKIIREEVQSTVQPMQETFQQTQQRSMLERARAGLKAAAPHYDPAQHDAELANAMRRYGVNNLEAAARIAHPEWFVPQAPAEAPVADVPASQAPARQNDVAALQRELADPRTPTGRRQEIATLLSNMDSSVERALGW